MPVVSRSCTVAVLALGVTAALAGCSDEPAGNTVGLVYCTSPAPGAGDTEQVEYRQGDEVVASTELEVGSTYRAEVPANGLTEIYVDGRLVGSSGEDVQDPDGAAAGGYVALLGEGCPEYVEP